MENEQSPNLLSVIMRTLCDTEDSIKLHSNHEPEHAHDTPDPADGGKE